MPIVEIEQTLAGEYFVGFPEGTLVQPDFASMVAALRGYFGEQEEQPTSDEKQNTDVD